LERLDKGSVPVRALSSGAEVPAIGLGTFGSDKYGPAEVAAAVREAASVGYRHFDCASVYRNEPEVGEALQGVAADGISRESLWITSKVWNDRHHEVEQSCEQSLADLKLDYLDLYLVHWPFPNSHGPGVSVDSRDPHAVPFVHEQFMETWRQMERLVDRGLVRHIGTSNMTVSKLTGVLRDASVRPAANEMEIHPHFQQPELFDFCVREQILPIGYCPIGSPSRPERDRTPEDTVDTEDPVILAAANRLGVHPAVICVLWQIQRGSVPIPFSVKRSQFEPMLRAVETMRLTDEEMDHIAGIDRHCRLIKGQVFLWESAKGWEDLWD
jgi:diketogulonate reductase-like aldo/keto reductase